MTTLNEARAKVRDLSTKAIEIANSRMDAGRMKAALDKLEPEIKHWTDEVDALEYVESKRKAFDAVAYNQDGSFRTPGNASPHFSSKGVLNAAPQLAFTEDQMRELHDAVLSHKSIQIEVGTKTVSGDLPAQLVPGIVALPHEPTRIANLLPSQTMGAPFIEYLRHVSTTGTAGMVAPGGLKPAVTLNTDKITERAKKIAVTTTVNDEDLEDFAGFASYVQGELTRLVVDEENGQILTGDGTGENLTGLLVVSGILTRVKGAAPETGIDTLELAAADLRTGPAFVEASLYAMHPTTWTTLRLLKDSQGRYLLGNPAEMDAAKLWGRPVVQTTSMAVGTVAAINGPAAGAVHWRKGMVVQSDYGSAGFEHNTTTLRAEERLALEIPKPAAIIKVTGL